MKAMTQVKKFSQGVDITDAAFGAAGLAGASMLPNYVVASAVTTTDKVLRLGAALVSAMAVGFVGRQVSPSAGKAAVLGGFAGTLVQGIEMFTGFGVKGARSVNRRVTSRKIGTAFEASPAYGRDDEMVSVIEP